MTKRHDAVYGDILSGLPEGAGEGGAPRFLKRSSTLAEQASGERQEKVLRLVDPATCRMWERHNRAYDLLAEENCRDLIDGIVAQGRQEFPAIVRRLPDGESHRYEVICGARRHFAVTWLRANNYPQFKYLIEERELTDEEAFRLADIENRDREDISDYERARDYAHAVDLYYQGKQKLMAERLECSETWLSRHLQLARLPKEVVRAFSSIRDIREIHARTLKPLLATDESRERVLAEARALADERAGQGAAVDAAAVIKRLKSAGGPPKSRQAADKTYRHGSHPPGVHMRRKGKRVQLEFNADFPENALREAIEQFLADRKAARG